MKQHCLILIGILFSVHLFAQTGIGTTTPNASAKLDVYATNKGFLPPRVTLTSITDVTTIASPAEGLLVYNVGSVGLQAGYYYWNGGNWATIATATSAGNGVTAMDMVKLYGEAWSSATNKIGNSNGYSFTVPVSGRYLFDFSSLTYGGTSFTINFYVRQGITNLGSDGQVSTNNGVRVEYNGKVEVNLQAGITYNVYVTSTNPNRGAEDYDRVYYKLVAGNLPVTGQTVEYGIARYSGADGGALSATSQVPFDATAAGNLNWSGNKFTLKANKTYELESSLIIFNTTGGSAARFQIYDYTNSVVLANGMFMSQNGAGTYSPNANTPMKCIVTPVADIQVGVRLLDYYGYAPGIVGNASVNGSTVPVNASYFIAKQIGSSAIVNPWILSGTNAYNVTGNVGIGTNAPTNKLHVYDNNNTGWSSVLTLDGNVATNGTSFNIRNNNDVEWHIDNHGSASSTPNSLSLWNSATNTSVFMLGTDGQLKLNTNSNTSLNITANTTDNNGMIILNANTGSSWANNWHEYVLFQKEGSVIGNIVGGNNGTTIAYNTTSDYRLKTDFKPFNGIDLVNKMKIYDYAWKVDGSRMYGVKAHELQTVLPYLVFGEKDAVDKEGKIVPQTVDYSKLTPILVKAIQEQEIKIKAQDSRLLKMQKEKDILEKRVSDLELLLMNYIKDKKQ